MLRLALLVCLLAAACKGDKPSPSKQPSGGSQAPAPVAASTCGKAVAKGPIAWFEDDYAAALACAKEQKKPLVIDMWAPWCHTCISMQTTVFLDPSLKEIADKYVWVALDTDREENAAAVGKLSRSAMPTFYVIGPDEAVLSRFVGAATVAQFKEFLDAGTRAMIGGTDAGDAHLTTAQRALAKGDLESAESELVAALETAPTAWIRRQEAIYTLQMTKQKRGDTKGCVDLSEQYMPQVGQTAIATNFWAAAFECAGQLAKDAKGEAARAAKVREDAVKRLAAVLDDKEAPLSVDDRVEALGYLRDAQDELGKKAEAKATAERAKKIVDDATANAKTPFEKMTFIWPRADIYAYLGKPLDLVADYEALAAQLPKEYDPPARLGWLYMKAGKLAEAATWTDKAIALAYGPRKARVLAQRAEIAAAAKDRDAEKKYRTEVVKLWESLPEGQKSADSLAKAQAALAAIDAPEKK